MAVKLIAKKVEGGLIVKTEGGLPLGKTFLAVQEPFIFPNVESLQAHAQRAAQTFKQDIEISGATRILVYPQYGQSTPPREMLMRAGN